ncbi:hypothetical protein, partial [Streptomyces avermitilis]|uniref:hypothetical protein n=1 Tax=Streptomyces avermitilis TaxID=33903 RepID=UPI0021191C00
MIAAIDAFTLRAVPAADTVSAYEPYWRPAPRVRRDPARTVVVLDAGSQGTELSDALTAAGVTVRRIEPSAGFDAEATVRALPSGQVHVVHLAGEQAE